jgi:hypothetical protein
MPYTPYKTIFRDSNVKRLATTGVPIYPLGKTAGLPSSLTFQTFTADGLFSVPNDIRLIYIAMYGAGGTSGTDGTTTIEGGAGAFFLGSKAVTPTEVLTITIGAPNGGGQRGTRYGANAAGNGGGLTSVVSNSITAYAGAGGGGFSAVGFTNTGPGGNGGYYIGGDGTYDYVTNANNSGIVAKGGNTTGASGGAGGTWTDINGTKTAGSGSSLLGGSWTGENPPPLGPTFAYTCGGGGAGYYGGGAGMLGCGAGGSSYFNGTLITYTDGGGSASNTSGVVLIGY